MSTFSPGTCVFIVRCSNVLSIMINEASEWTKESVTYNCATTANGGTKQHEGAVNHIDQQVARDDHVCDVVRVHADARGELGILVVRHRHPARPAPQGCDA